MTLKNKTPGGGLAGLLPGAILTESVYFFTFAAALLAIIAA